MVSPSKKVKLTKKETPNSEKKQTTLVRQQSSTAKRRKATMDQRINPTLIMDVMPPESCKADLRVSAKMTPIRPKESFEPSQSVKVIEKPEPKAGEKVAEKTDDSSSH